MRIKIWILSILMLSVILFYSVLPASAEISGYRVYGSCKNDKKLIALTFDDGPHPKNTPVILDILAHYGVKATFFEVGSNVEHYPEVSRRVIAEGHEIGNHTYTHPHVKNLSLAELEKEVAKCETAIKKVTGTSPVLFRPPEGVIDDAVKVMSTDREYSVILWSVDTRDWAGTSTSVIVKNVMKNVKSGDIILMHDYVTKSCNTVAALKIIIPRLLDEGYTFVTVSRLIEEKK